jgi:exodeoxyribonuclease III
LKIITYNVNGLRGTLKKGFEEWLAAVNADVVCLQEVKSHLTSDEVRIFEKLGYASYWHFAEKKGYSGVAILSRTPAKSIETGCNIPQYDREGRIIRADFEHFSLLNVYMPSGSSGQIRTDFKAQWLIDFNAYILCLKKDFPNLIICGDFNICHQAVDIHNPKANANASGFLPAERQWMTDFLASGFVDGFRHFNAEPHHYTWWSYRAGARKKNLGWRIDYHLISQSVLPLLKRCVILKEVGFSDHCPVLLEIDT